MVNKEAVLGFIKKNEQAVMIVGGGILGVLLLFGFVSFRNRSIDIKADLTPTPTPTIEQSPTPSPTDIPDYSPTPTPKKAKPTSTPNPTNTPTPGPSTTSSPNATSTPTPSITPSVTPTPTPNSISSISITDVSVDPGSYTGPCPKQFNFSAKITVNAAGTVTYKWERSDSSTSSDQTVNFGAAGIQTVTTLWSLGSAGNIYNNYWEKLVISSPSNVTGSQATFSLTCT